MIDDIYEFIKRNLKKSFKTSIILVIGFYILIGIVWILIKLGF